MKKLTYRKLMHDSPDLKYKKFKCSKGHEWTKDKGEWLYVLRQGGLRPYFLNPSQWPPDEKRQGVVLCNQCLQTHFPELIAWARKMCGEVWVEE